MRAQSRCIHGPPPRSLAIICPGVIHSPQHWQRVRRLARMVRSAGPAHTADLGIPTVTHKTGENASELHHAVIHSSDPWRGAAMNGATEHGKWTRHGIPTREVRATTLPGVPHSIADGV